MQLKIILTTITIALLCSVCFLLGKCQHKSDNSVSKDQALIDSLKAKDYMWQQKEKNLVANLDSLAKKLIEHKEAEKVYVDRWHTITKTLIDSVSSDSAKNVQIFKEVVADCDSALAAKDSVKNDCFARDSAHVEMEKVLRERIAVRDSELVVKDDQIERERKKGNVKAVKTGILSTIGGFILGLLVP